MVRSFNRPSRINLTILADIDECVRGLDDCDIIAVCINLNGTYNCSCMTGYKGNGFESNCCRF